MSRKTGIKSFEEMRQALIAIEKQTQKEKIEKAKRAEMIKEIRTDIDAVKQTDNNLMLKELEYNGRSKVIASMMTRNRCSVSQLIDYVTAAFREDSLSLDDLKKIRKIFKSLLEKNAVIEKEKRKQQENRELKEIINSRKIESLIHFTRIENLDSILSIGILPRLMLETRNIPFIYNDSLRADYMNSCTCVSICPDRRGYG